MNALGNTAATAAAPLFALAVRHHRAGRIVEAMRAYGEVLAADPRHTGALSNLGVGLASLGRTDDAVSCYEAVLAITPEDADVLTNLGNLYQSSGNAARAEQCYRRALDLAPAAATRLNYVELLAAQDRLEDACEQARIAIAAAPELTAAQARLGTLLLARGLFPEASDVLQAAVARAPHDMVALLALGDVRRAVGDLNGAELWYRAASDLAEAGARPWMRLGALYQAAGRIDDAVAAYQAAAGTDPGPEAAMALGAVLHAAARHAEAATVFAAAADRHPGIGEPLANFGLTLLAQGEFQRAHTVLNDAATRFPHLVAVHDGLATVLLRQGRYDEAVASARRSLALVPDSADALSRLALALLVQPKSPAGEALVLADRALTIAPRFLLARWARSQALAQLGRTEEGLAAAQEVLASAEANDIATLLAVAGVFEACGRRDEALKVYESILRLDGKNDFARAKVLEIKLVLCDWRDYGALVAETLDSVRAAVEVGGPLPIVLQDLHNLPTPPALLAAAARRRAQLIEAEVSDARTRVQFDFGDRLARWRNGERRKLRVGYAVPFTHFSSFPKLHQAVVARHDRGRYELFGYSVRPSNGTEFDRAYRASFDVFRDIPGGAHDVAAQQIFDDQVDVLIDVTGHTAIHCQHVMAMRPAPVQAETFASSFTTGAAYINFLLSDRIFLRPQFAQYCTERLVFLPDSMMLGVAAGGSERVFTRAELGLPDDAFVLCNFNQPFKFDPSVFAAWMRILSRLPHAVLWLGAWDPITRRNLHAEAERQGVGPSRVVFSEIALQGDHLARLGHADLMVDNRFHGGGVTTTDGLSAGVPLLTCPGEVPAASTGASLAHAFGMPEFIVADMQAYEERAVALGSDPVAYGALRARTAEKFKTAPLFDVARYTAHLERAIDLMWESTVTGTTGPIDVPALQKGQ